MEISALGATESAAVTALLGRACRFDPADKVADEKLFGRAPQGPIVTWGAFEGRGRCYAIAQPYRAPPPEGSDPLSAMLSQMMGSLAPMMLSVTAGGMLGHLAQRSLGQYDLPIPRSPSDELLLRRTARGDTAAFEVIYDRHSAAAYARAVGCAAIEPWPRRSCRRRS